MNDYLTQAVETWNSTMTLSMTGHFLNDHITWIYDNPIELLIMVFPDDAILPHNMW